MCHSALETICDRLLSSSVFKFNLRRYNLGGAAVGAAAYGAMQFKRFRR